MATTPIDYDALAQQARNATPEPKREIDYDALAAKARDGGEQSNLSKALNVPRDLVEGVGSGLAKTGVGVYNLARKIPGVSKVLPPVSPAIQGATQAPDYSGLGWPGKLGRTAEQVGEFFVPAGKVAEGAKAIEGATAGMKAAPALNALGKAGLEAGSAAGVTAAQTGGDTDAMRNAALTAGAASAVAPPILKGAGAAGKAILGKTTGAGEEAIGTAATNPTPAFKTAMRGGTDEGEIVGSFKKALQNVKDARGDAYRQQLASLPQQQLQPTVLDPVKQALTQKLQSFRVNIGPNGVLDFSHSTIPKGEEAIIKNIADDVNGWSDLTPLGIDALKRRISNYYSPTSDVRAFTATIENATKRTLHANIPGYSQMTQDYANASDFIKKVEQEFSLGPTVQQGTAIRKISYALKQNNEYRKVLADALDSFTQSDLRGQLAGYHLKDTLPKGLTGVNIGSGLTILGAIGAGALTPSAAVSMMAASPRLVGEVLSAMSKFRGAAPSMAAAVPKVAAAFTVNRDKPQPQIPSPEPLP